MAFARALFFIAILWGTASTAFCERRVALVVGINRYDNLPADRNLKKAAGDARAIGAALQALGFDVEIAENPGRSEFNQVWVRFLNRISPGNIAAFHFSGHGVELSGANYLIPRDVPNVSGTGEQLLRNESISLNGLLDDLREKMPRVSFLIVDACRDNPFTDRRGRSVGGTRGLGRAEPPKGSFVMYAAGTGQEALDRLSDADTHPNSVYTRSLLPLLSQPGLSLSDIAKRVKGSVRDLAQQVGHEQTPAYYDEIIGDFYPAGEPQTSETRPPQEPGRTNVNEIAHAWNDIKDIKDVSVFEAFRSQYGTENGLYDALASQRIQELKRAPAVPMPASPEVHDFIFSDSDRRLLTPMELRGLSKAELRLARNEIFARRGRLFDSPGLQQHFSRFAWYRPFTKEPALNPVEERNVKLIEQAEATTPELAPAYPMAGDFLFADSERRLLAPAELRRLSKAELRIARNEIFARRGRIFDSADLQHHFGRFSWYRPFTKEPALNPVEERNVKLIEQAEAARP